LPIVEALKDTPLHLGEDSSSEDVVDGKARGWVGSRGPTTGRVVVINRGEVTEVREKGQSVRSAPELATLESTSGPFGVMPETVVVRHSVRPPAQRAAEPGRKPSSDLVMLDLGDDSSAPARGGLSTGGMRRAAASASVLSSAPRPQPLAAR